MNYTILTTSLLITQGVVMGALWHFVNRSNWPGCNRIQLGMYFVGYLILIGIISVNLLNWLFGGLAIAALFVGYGLSWFILKEGHVRKIYDIDRRDYEYY